MNIACTTVGFGSLFRAHVALCVTNFINLASNNTKKTEIKYSQFAAGCTVVIFDWIINQEAGLCGSYHGNRLLRYETSQFHLLRMRKIKKKISGYDILNTIYNTTKQNYEKKIHI